MAISVDAYWLNNIRIHFVCVPLRELQSEKYAVSNQRMGKHQNLGLSSDLDTHSMA